GVEHAGQRSEALQQFLGQRLGVAAGASAEEQVFQHLVVGERFGAPSEQPPTQSRAVAGGRVGCVGDRLSWSARHLCFSPLGAACPLPGVTRRGAAMAPQAEIDEPAARTGARRLGCYGALAVLAVVVVALAVAWLNRERIAAD